MMRSLAIAALLLPAAPLAAQAPKHEPSPAFALCMKQDDAARGIAAAVDVCLNTEESAQELRLGEAYEATFDALTGWDQVRFYNEQNQWRASLDERCSDKLANQSPANRDQRAFRLCRIEEIGARATYVENYSAE